MRTAGRSSLALACVGLVGLCHVGRSLSAPSAAVPTTSGYGVPPVLCERGYAYSQERAICREVNAEVFGDEELYNQGRALALAGRYDSARELLGAVRDQADAKVLTMRGYVERKSGRFEEGIAFYKQALAIDPENLDALEYLGEGYVEIGRPDLAEVELEKLDRICGAKCEQYRELAAAIARTSSALRHD